MHTAGTDWWEVLEGRSAGQPDRRDAEHWIGVYDELIATLRVIADGMVSTPEAQALVQKRLGDCQLRRVYWLGVTHPLS
jgi:hypothetical protein